MNKKLGGLVFCVAASLMLLSFVLAQPNPSDFETSPSSSNLESSLNDFSSNYLNPIFGWILGDVGNGELLLVKFLFFILLLSMLFFIVRKVPTFEENLFVAWLIAIIVAVLAVRFLSTPALVNFLWLPTGVLGVVLGSLLPFLLFFFFIERMPYSTIRKVGWVTFTVVFFGLSFYRWDSLKISPPLFDFINNLGWFYIVIGVLSLLSIIFDRYIRARFTLATMNVEQSKRNIMLTQPLLRDLERWEGVLSSPYTKTEERTYAQNEINRIQKRIAKLKST